MSESECEYCGEMVEYPLPIHPKCAEIWLRGYHAREIREVQNFVNQVMTDYPVKETGNTDGVKA